MKKIKLLLLMITVLLISNVNAAETAYLNVDCGKGKTNIGNDITCDINVVYEGVAFNTVEFTYETDLNVEVKPTRKTSVNDSEKRVTITSERLFEDVMKNTETVATMDIKGSSITTGTEKKIVFKNISISKDKEEETIHGSSDVTKTITFIDPASLSSDCTLKSLSVDNVEVAGFSSSKDTYSIVVHKNIFFVDAKASSDKAIVTGVGDNYVPVGNTRTITVTVQAENGDTKDYKLNVTNRDLSKDNNLKTLEIYSGKNKIDFNYDPNKTSYNVELQDSTISKITIKAILNDENAKFVSKYGPRDVNINYGSNKIEIQVEAEDKTKKTYTINITRKDERDTDTTLSSLQVNEENIPLQDDTYEYNTKFKYNVENASIKATPTSEKAKVEAQDVSLKVGENTVKIKVVAENGSSKEYTITITRLTEEESKEVLENISITDYSLAFDVNKTSYDLEISKETEKLNINVTPSYIKYEVTGNEKLKDGSIINIKVNDDNGEHEYIINIHKPVDNMIYIICYAVFGVGLILLITSIIVTIRRKKK